MMDRSRSPAPRPGMAGMTGMGGGMGGMGAGLGGMGAGMGGMGAGMGAGPPGLGGGLGGGLGMGGIGAGMGGQAFPRPTMPGMGMQGYGAQGGGMGMTGQSGMGGLGGLGMGGGLGGVGTGGLGGYGGGAQQWQGGPGLNSAMGQNAMMGNGLGGAGMYGTPLGQTMGQGGMGGLGQSPLGQQNFTQPNQFGGKGLSPMNSFGQQTMVRPPPRQVLPPNQLGGLGQVGLPGLGKGAQVRPPPPPPPEPSINLAAASINSSMLQNAMMSGLGMESGLLAVEKPGALAGLKTRQPPPPPPADGQPPPPPPPPSPGGSPGASGKPMGPGSDFEHRLNELKMAYPSIEVPSEVWSWTIAELDAYFASGGAKRPEVDKSRTPKRKLNGEEYDVQEALQVQQNLHRGFSDKCFQDALKALQRKFPDRKVKGHPDGAAYFEAFESLTLSVHAKVLPDYGLSPDWDGVRELISRMVDALRHPKVKKMQEEINVLMGLPRNAAFTPPGKGADMFIFRPNKDGPIPGFPRDMVRDEDGDEAHEFFVEDADGELKPRGPTAMEQEVWYQVVHTPAVVIREQPDEKSKMVGRKKAGKRLRVQQVKDDKWLQLHHSELVRLGVQEAWVLLDGAEMGLAGQKLLEKVG